jgi:hypothetical protein
MTKQIVFKTNGSNIEGALIINGAFERAIVGRTEIDKAVAALTESIGSAGNGSIIVDIPDSK